MNNQGVRRRKISKRLFYFVRALILLVLLVSGITLKAGVGEASNTISVPTDYPTIQAGINAAASGDTILVDSGTYFENVVINKTVSLIGQNKATTIIDGSGAGKVIVVAANNVNLSGFTVRHSGQQPLDQDSGIFIDFRSANSKVSDIVVVDNYHGIFLESTAGNVVSFNNVSSNTGRGIYLEFSSANTIFSNSISRNEQDNGIELFDSSNNIVAANMISRNGFGGVYLGESFNNVIKENGVSNNSETGVYLEGSSSNILYRNNFFFNGLNALGHQFSFDSLNTWDNGAEGNYWNDYIGNDLDGDGVGDTGTIPHLEVDSYPLIEPWSPLRVFSVDGNVVTILSNSTIAEFRFIQSQAEIGFNATGASGTLSFCNVTVPKQLLNASYPRIWTVAIDGIYFSHAVTENITHTSVHFAFAHSTRQVKIQVVELTNPPPTAEFTYSPTDPTPYDTVSFADSSTDDHGIASWQWEFGDGVNSTVQHPQHKYAVAGAYIVTLNVTDEGGEATLTSKVVSVRKIRTNTTVNASSKVNQGELFRVTADLHDENQIPLPNATIWFYILQEKWVIIDHNETDPSGIVTLDYQPVVISGMHLFKVEFNGTQILARSSSTFQVEIEASDGPPPPSSSGIDELLLRIGTISVILVLAIVLVILWRRRKVSHSLKDVKKGTR